MDDAAIRAITRPHSNLMTMYFLQAVASLIAFPFVLLPLYFRYHTLRYTFDDEGISACWGILFRREIYLNYRRIQDIHVSRNLFERWLGIGKVAIQTASGSASAELVIEGMQDYDAVRDFIYARTRGSQGLKEEVQVSDGPAGEDEAIALLRGITDDMAAIRRAFAGPSEEN